jgi:hypothetical protein
MALRFKTIEKPTSHYFLTAESQPPCSRSSSSCVVCICIFYIDCWSCLSPRSRPSCGALMPLWHSILSLAFTATAQRVIDVWAKSSALLCIKFWLLSCHKVASFPCLADCQGGDAVRARVAVMAAPPWLLLFFLLCWLDLSQPAYPTNQPHQVKVCQNFAYMLTLWNFWAILQTHQCRSLSHAL